MGECIYILNMICYNEVQYYTTGEYTNLDPRSRSRINDDYMQYRRSLSSNTVYSSSFFSFSGKYSPGALLLSP